MFKFNLRFIILLPVLLYLVLPAESEFQRKSRAAVAPQSEVVVPIEENTIPCSELQVTSAGAVCKTRFGLVASLDFPQVNLKSALAGDKFLPQAENIFTADEKTVDGKSYRNIAFTLRWEPNTPEFLQIYLNEYLPYWGNRIPYRLFWSARYEECLDEDCTNKALVNVKCEFLPSDIKDLDSSLAADANFNGVPVAFWNMNVIP
jgi:hypothetical protein